MQFLLVSLLISTTFLSSFANAATLWNGFKGCGMYQALGIGRSTKNGLVIVINEKTQSEIVLTLPIANEATLAPYVDRELNASVILKK